jgi:hypothetical protein
MASGLAPGPWNQLDDQYSVDDGTLCRAPCPAPRSVGAASAVAHWGIEKKLLEAVRRTTTRSPVAAAEGTAVAVSTEQAIVAEARGVLSSPEMMQIRAAQAAGESVAVRIRGRLIQYEPGFPYSGLTNFEQNGFVLGRYSFSSQAELTKTLLHELYRLETSQLGRGVVPEQAAGMQEIVSAETEAAANFAEEAFEKYFCGAK